MGTVVTPPAGSQVSQPPQQPPKKLVTVTLSSIDFDGVTSGVRQQAGVNIAAEIQTRLRGEFPMLVVKFVRWIESTGTRRRLLAAADQQIEFEFSSSSTDSTDSTAENAAQKLVDDLNDSTQVAQYSDSIVAAFSSTP